MAIKIITTVSFPFGNASANRIHSFAKGFNFNGAETEVICLTANLPETYSLSYKGLFDKVSYIYLPNRVHRPKSFLKRRYFRFLGILKAIIGVIFHYDKSTSVILIATPSIALFTLLLSCRLKGISIYAEACEYPYLSLKQSIFRQLFLKCFYQLFTGYIFESVPVHEHYKKYISKDKPVIIIPATQIYDDIIIQSPSSDEKYFAYCGSVTSEEKDGLRQVIQAFNQIAQTDKNVKFYIVGRINNQKYYQSLLDLIQKLQLGSRVILTKEVSRKEYVNYLVNAYAFIVGKTANSIHSGLPSSKVVEYLFTGHPVIMSKDDGYGEILEDRKEAYFIDVTNRDEITEAFQYLLNNPLIAKTIGLNGLKQAYNNFDYKTHSKSIIEFIAS
ncbi:MAG TPA: hypothetical protein DIC42_05560 [Holosporales bacterium]|nr:hypothetical protein [Holosporales bacterium]